MASIRQFYKELRRRNVVKVGIAYAVVAWLLVEISSTVLPIFKAPDFVLQVFVYFLMAGLPIALIFAWAFEMTSDGVKRSDEVQPDQSITAKTGSRLNVFIIAVLAVALAYFIIDEIFIETGAPVTVASVGKSIAVLPFDNRSARADDEFFVDGVHDDILTQLAHISSLKVISRTSVLEYRDTTKNMKTIGEELGVGAILEGGVQRAGDHVRINMQLIDAATDEHLWAETFDRELTAANIFAIQTEIATRVATALRAALTAGEVQRINTTPTDNLQAYEAYLLGKQQVARRSQDAFLAAQPLFKRAIGLDPNFALAYVGLGDATQLLFGYTGSYLYELLDEAEISLNKAIELDPELGEAYASLGLLEDYRGNLDLAEAHLELSLELAPNYVHGHRWYGSVMNQTGRYDEALRQAEISVALDPLSKIANINYAQNLAREGRIDEAKALLDKVAKSNPGVAWPNFLIGDFLGYYSGSLDLAIIEYKKGLAKESNTSTEIAWLGVLYLLLGDDESAEYWLERATIASPDDYWIDGWMALLYVYRDEIDKAAEFAEKSIASNPVQLSRVYRVLRNRDLAAGRADRARALYETQFSELLSNSNPRVDHETYDIAIDLALVLIASGETEQADRLLELGLDHIKTEVRNRLGYSSSYGIYDVRVFALQGKKDLALASMREAIDMGWRDNPKLILEHDPTLTSLHDEPEFQAMIDEISDDLAAQLVRLRQISPNGKSLDLN